ncbi:hypothetical protein [Natronincola ferrireducens]|uniref:Uncharacterized protein n=1 Tax=Natronincola ferrireducens TaxID=393762 RepID=A0A1G8Z7K7_9FIRM|nr:hypothetical protein [Natronincola ferrireducens]SDK11051.1 hypothetical protein SAMN05660472_00763 [Natronincola ferrireducens]
MGEKLKGVYVKYRIGVNLGLIWLVLIIAVVGHSSYTTHKVEIVNDGIMYQAGNNQISIPVGIEIQGKYFTTFGGKPKRFEGQIIVDDDVFPYTIHFHSNMGVLLTTYGSTYGDLHVSDEFDSFTITISKLREDARSKGWSSSDGWIISAPAVNRKEAVTLSNKLLSKYYRNIEIE